jgi:hypothetical protein
MTFSSTTVSFSALESESEEEEEDESLEESLFA